MYKILKKIFSIKKREKKDIVSEDVMISRHIHDTLREYEGKKSPMRNSFG